MNYYFVNKAPVIGKSHCSIEGIPDSYDFDAKNSINNIIENAPLKFIPNINNCFSLDPKLKLIPDNLSQSFIYTQGLMVSKKLKKIILDHKTQKSVFYSAKIKVKGSVKEYFWMHMEERMEQYIDYKKSTFFIRKQDDPEKFKEVSFKNSADLQAKTKKWVNSVIGYNLSIKELVFRDNYKAPDIFFYH